MTKNRFVQIASQRCTNTGKAQKDASPVSANSFQEVITCLIRDSPKRGFLLDGFMDSDNESIAFIESPGVPFAHSLNSKNEDEQLEGLLSTIGYGPYQRKVFIVSGLGWLCDNLWMTVSPHCLTNLL
jgi:hypothetical protein